jgi:hypothetical protein
MAAVSAVALLPVIASLPSMPSAQATDYRSTILADNPIS